MRLLWRANIEERAGSRLTDHTCTDLSKVVDRCAVLCHDIVSYVISFPLQRAKILLEQVVSLPEFVEVQLKAVVIIAITAIIVAWLAQLVRMFGSRPKQELILLASQRPPGRRSKTHVIQSQLRASAGRV